MDDLDREIDAALAVAPSREFLARVRSRIQREPTPSIWQGPRALLAAGTVAVVAAAVIALPRGHRVPAPDEAAAPAVSRSHPATSLSGLSASVGPPSVQRRSRPRTLPAVIVATNELNGLRGLEAIVREGRLAFVFPDESAQNAAPAASVATDDIVIAPIEIVPIGISADVEGEQP
jgi:hypothetical protein